jgi:hypothetical protein
MEVNMLDTSNFIVRISGRGPSTYYIDCGGLYHISDIATQAGISADRLSKIYASNGGEVNRELDVYYFGSIESAKSAISAIFAMMQNSNKGKSVFFTEDEIEYLRKAMINDAMGFAGNNSRTVDIILKKLNG